MIWLLNTAVDMSGCAATRQLEQAHGQRSTACTMHTNVSTLRVPLAGLVVGHAAFSVATAPPLAHQAADSQHCKQQQQVQHSMLLRFKVGGGSSVRLA
jgi:hypothetical protein